MLDYDGTLAPFHIERMKAVPAPGIVERLERIAETGGTRIVFITGRPAAEIIQLMPLSGGVEIWGCHGREYRAPDGTISSHGVSEEHERTLEEGRRRAAECLGESLVERKIGCVAIHWRPVDPSRRAAIRAELERAWHDLIAERDMQMQVFDGGIELSARGRSKGDAVDAILGSVDLVSECAAFMGDDYTDEDGFRALGQRGLSLLVRNEPRETAADLRITTPDGVLDFLAKWHRALGGGST